MKLKFYLSTLLVVDVIESEKYVLSIDDKSTDMDIENLVSRETQVIYVEPTF